MPKRTLFLNPPSFEGFDGGASSRWPATREIESYWYPIWLCYPAGMLADSKVVDAPPHGITPERTIAMANDSNYGLSAAIFTQNIDWSMKFAREVHSGNLMINSGPQFRADLMPYGGIKESGMGKEGPKYAVEEMTELKMVVYHP